MYKATLTLIISAGIAATPFVSNAYAEKYSPYSNTECAKESSSAICKKAAQYSTLVATKFAEVGLAFSSEERGRLQQTYEKKIARAMLAFASLANNKAVLNKAKEALTPELVKAIVVNDEQQILERIEGILDYEFSKEFADWDAGDGPGLTDYRTGKKALPGKSVEEQKNTKKQLLHSLDSQVNGGEPTESGMRGAKGIAASGGSGNGPSASDAARFAAEARLAMKLGRAVTTAASLGATLAFQAARFGAEAAVDSFRDHVLNDSEYPTPPGFIDDSGLHYDIVGEEDGAHVVEDDYGNQFKTTREGGEYEPIGEDASDAGVGPAAGVPDEEDNGDDQTSGDDNANEEAAAEDDEESNNEEEQQDDNEDSAECDPAVTSCPENDGEGEQEQQDSSEEEEPQSGGKCIDMADDNCGEREIQYEGLFAELMFDLLGYGLSIDDAKEERSYAPHINWGDNAPSYANMEFDEATLFNMTIEAIGIAVNWGPNGAPTYLPKRQLNPGEIVNPSINPGDKD